MDNYTTKAGNVSKYPKLSYYWPLESKFLAPLGTIAEGQPQPEGLRDRINIRSFKSLNRKDIQSPKNCNSQMRYFGSKNGLEGEGYAKEEAARDQPETYNKQNISVNSKAALAKHEGLIEDKVVAVDYKGKNSIDSENRTKGLDKQHKTAYMQYQQSKDSRAYRLFSQQANGQEEKEQKNPLQTSHGDGNRSISKKSNRSSSTNKHTLIEGPHQKAQDFLNSSNYGLVGNSPSTNSTAFGSARLRNPQAPSKNLASPLKVVDSSCIIHEAISKDGLYKVVSKALDIGSLKEAVDFQLALNMKSKKQGGKQKTGVATPRHKINVDPSKISSKQNGNILAYAVNSNQGISRKYNEDRVSIILNINKNGIKSSYFAVYDGHGGSNCCDFLTQNLHQFIINSMHFPGNPRQAIHDGIRLAQEKFIELVKETYTLKQELDRSGSCVIIALVVGDDCYIVNVGDSRAILSCSRGKTMYSLSRDHKPTDSAEQSRILREGGKIYRTEMERIIKQKSPTKSQLRTKENPNPDNDVIIGPLRVYPGKLSVTRTIGDIEAKLPEFGGIPNCISIEPQICKYELKGNEDFILLGCDGIFERLESSQVIEEVWKTISKNKKTNIHEVAGLSAEAVVRLSMEKKSSDNLTALVICLGTLGLGTSLLDYASV